MKKVRKIKWLNVIKLMVFVLCVCGILHDIYVLTIKTAITGNMYGFTWFGLITFLLLFGVAVCIYADFEEQTKSTISTTDQSFRNSTRK